jgi:excisionase family DNA binding protein
VDRLLAQESTEICSVVISPWLAFRIAGQLTAWHRRAIRDREPISEELLDVLRAVETARDWHLEHSVSLERSDVGETGSAVGTVRAMPMNSSQVAAELALGQRRVQQLARSGALRCTRSGRSLLFDRADVAAFIAGGPR